MHRALLGWLDDPPADRGIRFAVRGGTWDVWPYQRLAFLVQRVASRLVDLGLETDDVVVAIQRSGPAFVGTLFGVLHAGGIPCPVLPPPPIGDLEAYAQHVARLCAAAAPALVVTDDALAPRVSALAAAVGVPATVTFDDLVTDDRPGPSAPRRRPAQLALLQFTSGSSGSPRGVRVPFPALEANVDAIRRWLQMTDDDVTASWLPVHHDMGLIGCLLTPVVNGSDLWLLRPEDFVRDPLGYLRCFGVHGARLTAMPNFALQHILRHVAAEQLRDCDFSQWRAIIVGAERLDHSCLERLVRLLAPFGMQRRALLPAYGLAEATLAVTGLELAEEWTAAWVEPGSLRLGGTVAAGVRADSRVAVVACGRPLSGVSVRIADEHGRDLPDGLVGEIVVAGSSVADGYSRDVDSPSATTISDGNLHTGDAGFLLDRQLYVLGRLGDSLKVRGRTVFAEDLEAGLVAAGLPALRLAAVLGHHDGTPTAVVVIEQPEADWLQTAGALARRSGGGADVVVVAARRGVIPRTSSGKPKRRTLWQAFVHGDLTHPVASDVRRPALGA